MTKIRSSSVTRRRLVSAAAAAALFMSGFAHAPAGAQQPADGKADFTAVAPLADDQTLAVIEVNLDALDVGAAAKWVSEAADKSGQPQESVAQAKQQVEQASTAAGKAIADLRAAKAHKLYWLFSLTDPPATGGAGPGLMVVPLGQGADAAAIANVLKTGSAQGAAGAGPQGDYGPTTATVGSAVVAGSAARVGQAKKPGANAAAAGGVDAAAVTEALSAGGDAPVRVALVASADLRKVLETQAPDLPAEAGGGRTEVLTKGIRWASVAIVPPPQGAFRITVRANDAEGATRTGEQITAILRVLREDRNARAAIGAGVVDDAVKQLAPRVEGNNVFVSVDQQAIERFVPAVAIGIREQREKAQRMVAMNNMRQILLGCVMYANDNKEALPPQEKWSDVLLKSQDLSKQVFANPRLPGRMPGFVYVRPQAGLRGPAETVVLYEPADVPGPLIGVGFLDGHVEMLTRERFDKEVKPKLPADAQAK